VTAGPDRTSETSGQPIILGLSLDHIQQQLSLIDTPTAGYEKWSGKINWMFDSSTSCHMIGDATILKDIKKISPVAIGLPNGTYTMVCE